MLSGGARFDNAVPQPFTTEPEMVPGQTSTPPPPRPAAQTLPESSARARRHAGLPGERQPPIMGSGIGKTALVAERTTGAVKEVSVSAEPKVKYVIPVDGSGDGGLMSIVMSPTYPRTG